MKYRYYLLIILFIGLANFTTLANSKGDIKSNNANPAKNNDQNANPAKLPVVKNQRIVIKRLKSGKIKLGKIIVDPKNHELSFPAVINLQKGILEAIISTPNGRLHESLLKSEIKALYLQTSLYLLGAKNGSCYATNKNKQGDLFDIELEWVDLDGKKKREPIEKWIQNAKTLKGMKKYGWVFVGSSIIAGDFAADLTGNLVICYHVANTILDFPHAMGKDDTIFVINEKKKKPGCLIHGSTD